MNKRQIDRMRSELITDAVGLIDEAFGGGFGTEDALEALRPIIADAETSPDAFRSDVRRAIAEQDGDWLDELTGTLEEQIRDANTDQLVEYYEHFAPPEDE